MYKDLYNNKKLIDFMRKERVSFEQLIRCFNFWSDLTQKERNKYIDDYSK